MKINRLDLIAKLNEIITAREGRADQAYREAVERREDEAGVYFTEHAVAWRQLADRIRVRNRQGRPITKDDVPESILDTWGRRDTPKISVFAPGNPVLRKDYDPRTVHLRTLLAVLESSPDEFVTDSSLDRLGSPLREVLRG